MSLFAAIADLDGPIKYEHSGKGHLKMVNHAHPFSLKEPEFEFIRKLIVDNNLQRGFEVATAFGISGLAASLGFKETGGFLVSMDAYVEEHHNNAGAYFNSEPFRNPEPDGLTSAVFLAEHFDTKGHVMFYIGWSPTDTPTWLNFHYGDRKLDYVFIDAGHITEWIWNDFTAVVPFLAPNAFVVFHDIYSDTFTPDLIDRIQRMMNSTLTIAVPHPEGENLGYIRYNAMDSTPG